MELIYSADMMLRSESNIQAAKVLYDIVKTPDAVTDYIKRKEVTFARVTKIKLFLS